LSKKYFIHATPTLFNAGTKRPQLSSCYLIAMEDDSIQGIFNTLHDCASISKWAGGIGMHIHNIRAKNTKIIGTNGKSNGIVPMLKVFNNTARYVDQGGGKRSGSFAIYLEPWHADIEDFLELRKNHGDEEMRARDLFYALWIPDLFMEKVEKDDYWYLMCPNQCPGLCDVYGKEFETLYNTYVNENKYNKRIKARELWFRVLDSQMETGTPYMLYKDAINQKSNQQNVGMIKSSNLCCEITEYSDDKETAVCNLASIALPQYVKQRILFDNPNHIVIYSKTKCKYCKMAKEKMDEFGLTYEVVILDDDETRREFYESQSKQLDKVIQSVPQIFVNDTHVGGYQDLKKHLIHEFDYNQLQQITEIVTENLNNIIDCNFYPTSKTYKSNMNHRPIGIGVQGLADTFAKLDVPFDSDEAQQINKDIFETIYYGSMRRSNLLAQQRNSAILQLQQEFVFDLYATIDGYLEWFIPLFKNNMYCKEFIYFEKVNHDPKIHENVTQLYHQLKPTFEEIFGKTFHKEFLTFLNRQEKIHKNKYMNYELYNEQKELLRKNTHHGAYSSFEGSPLSEGKFQFDLWNVNPSTRYDWDDLRSSIMEYGVRNSLCVAPMPTASTSQILANNECFEPFTSNIYSRRTLAGEFVVINKHLMKELNHEGLWNLELKNKIIEHKGSIQKIDEIPQGIKNKYKIVWDMSMKRLIDMAKDRGAFICQSQSMNLWVEDPNYKNLTSMHFYAWRAGLKTGIYYLRRKAKHQAQQFTIEPNQTLKPELEAHREDEAVCEMCSG
jgi:ribonucleoside-diphosphate reductase alpha subunit